MKKYIAFFKLRLRTSFQYRSATLAGIITQLSWACMQIMVFRALYISDAQGFAMSLSATCSYIWLQQAFLPFFMFWFIDNEIFESISNGNIVYELCKPIDVYNTWFIKNLANRTSKTILQCLPILIIALCLPEPYKLMLPQNFLIFELFIISMILSIIVTISLCMFSYIITFYTLSYLGIKTLFLSIVQFFSGAILPLPFFPNNIRVIIELLPFASMQNVPFRIYSGDITGITILNLLVLQLFWAFVLVFLGKLLCRNAITKVSLQGG